MEAFEVLDASATPSAPEYFRFSDRGQIEREVLRSNGSFSHSAIRATLHDGIKTSDDAAAIADQAFLTAPDWPDTPRSNSAVSAVDLFSGCGIMSLAVWEACRALGQVFKPLLAVDSNNQALRTFKKNFASAATKLQQVETVFDRSFGAALSRSELAVRAQASAVDMLVAGPPCQGHSDLNNHTRRNDPKNELYARVARAAEVLEPRHIIIENVSAVLHDRNGVVDRTADRLSKLGYKLDHGLVEASLLGVAQKRRRHILVASDRQLDIDEVQRKFARQERTVAWAISDLRQTRRSSAFDKAGKVTAKNKARIDYLFRHRAHDLPNSRRPDCHRLKTHSYRSVYGRLHWGKPAQTITTGFGCMGQGRYVHPAQRRTITPHEAARLQFIPDFFQFDSDIGRTHLSAMIGNAVPMKLTYVFALEMLR